MGPHISRRKVRTERSRVHESPELVVSRLELRMLVTRSRDEFLQNSPKYIGNDLDEELTDEDRLRAEILIKGQENERDEDGGEKRTYEDLTKYSAEAG